jgi:Flp pilus assembly protein TadG
MNAARENAARKSQRGQSIVELGLITPLLLIALYIPADFGIAFFMGNLTQTAAREGARVGSGLQKSGKVPDLIFSATEANTVRTQVSARMPSYLSDKKVTVKFYSGTECMEFLEVTAEGQYNFTLYRMMKLFGAPVPDQMTISRSTQMRYRYQPYMHDDHCTAAITYGPYPA